jgi:poly-gamma-glutamate synthesis protein (capsule biosynthesis protein)
MNRCFAVLCLVLAFGAPLAAAGESARLIFVGDIMLDDTPGKVIAGDRDPFAAFATIIDAADLRVGNLECVVARGGTREPGKPFAFRAHPRVLRFLARHIDAAGLANNHSGDYGPTAFAEMLSRLERTGVAYFGGGRDLAAAHRPLVVERRGVRIALLGYNEFFPRSFEATPDSAGIAWSEDEQVGFDIREARARGADLVIPVMHWGWEHETVAGARQRRLARILIDAGADAVVGGHPHVVQDVEVYRGKPIVYSLGNFVFDSFSDPVNNTGWLLRMDVDRQGVRRVAVVVASIDSEGLPHPERAAAPCWARGQAKWQTCPAVAAD